MQLSNFQTFIAVSKTGGFHSAAERLNITQAAVSARIKAFEDQLGQRVFDRGRSGASLTAAGKELLPHAENITRTWDHAKNMLGVPISRPVNIKIGAQFSTWAPLVLDWAALTTDTLPEAELDLVFDYHSNMLKSVQEGRLDIAITHAPAPETGLHMMPLPEETLVLVASRPCSLADDQIPDFLALDWGPQFNDQVKRMKGLLPQSKIHVGNGELGLKYISEHDACGYIPLRSARNLLQQKRLFRVKRAPKFKTPGNIIFSEDNPNCPFIERAVEGFGTLRSSL